MNHKFESNDNFKVAAQSAVDTVDAMGEGAVLMSLDGIIMTVNREVEELTGLKKTNMTGAVFADIASHLLLAEDLQALNRALSELKNERIPDLHNLVLRPAHSEPVVVTPSFSFIKSPEGTPLMAVLSLKNISQLHEANLLLEQIFNTTHMQIAYLDPDFNFVRVNRAYADACGRDIDFFKGKNHFDLYPDRENRAIFEYVKETNETVTVYEKPFDFPDQPERKRTYWDWSLHPIPGEYNETEGLLLCLLDTTERVTVRQQFADTQEKYSELVESANSIILRLSPDHRILFINKFGRNFFGYSEEELLGKSVLGAIVPEIDSSGNDMQLIIEQITEHPELYGSNENENICKDGRRVWVHWSNRAVRDDNGEVVELLCIGNDITQRKKLEESARKYQNRLRRLSDRLIKTEEEERRRIATHLHDSVIQMLSLSNIRLGGVKAKLGSINDESLLARIDGIRELLNDGITECRNLMGQLVPSLLYELGLLHALKDFAEKQSRIDGTPIEVTGDENPEPMDNALRSLLFQCARELVMNSLKYAGQCRINISVSKEGNKIVVEVRDDGAGFDPASLENNSLDHEEGGFGLFSIRERLEGLGGTLDIDSAPGKGTKARVVAPAKNERREQEKNEKS